MKMEDALARLNAAENCLKTWDYAGALLEAERCLELSAKTLLQSVGVSYAGERGKIPHDVSSKIPETFEKMRPLLDPRTVDYYRIELARAAVLLRMLTSIKQQLEYGVEGLAGIGETFGSVFSKELAEQVVALTRNTHWRIHDLLSRCKKSAV